jgi:GntR family transcriptional regulator
MPEPELPKYLQIAAHIRGMILRGELEPGAGVASEREIAAQWSVARPTVTKALDVLRRQGFLESKQGSGTFVCDRMTPLRARERYDPPERDWADAGAADHTVEFLRVGVVTVPNTHVADGLGVSDAAEVVERVALVSGESTGPVALASAWFPAELAEAAPALLRRERIRGGPARYVESLTGKRLTAARDRVGARLATPEERRLLGLPRPSAVLVYRLTVHDSDGAVVQFEERSYPQGRWMFAQEYPL